MWTDLAFRHPYELFVLNAVLNAALIYVAFSIAAWMHRGRRGERPGRRAMVIGSAFVGLLWGGTTIIDRAFSLDMLRMPGSVWDIVAAEPLMVLFPVLGTVAVGHIVSNAMRGGAVFALVVVYVLLLENPAFSPAFFDLSPLQRTAHWGILLFGALFAAAGAIVMTTRSLSSRLAGVLATTWGLKLVGVGLLSGSYANLNILEPLRGTITPALILAITGTVAFAALNALAEARRLRGSEYRQDVLHESEARMRMLADATQEGLVIHRNGTVLDVNDKMRGLLGGFDPVGGPLSAVLPTAEEWDAAERFAEGPSDTTLRLADGSMAPVEAVCRPLDDGRIVTALRDQSERDQARAAAARERKRLRLALDAADEGFVIYDAQEKLVLANEAFVSLWPGMRDVIVPGATHETIVRGFADAGTWPSGIDLDAHVTKRLAMFRAGREDHVAQLADGRWLLARDRKLPTGETVSMRIDVSRVKERERELEQSEERVRFLARNDSLTGIANRRTFDADLAERMASLTDAEGRHRLALLMIDLDRFKPVNDQHGHAAGDELLRVLASRFENELRARPRARRHCTRSAADMVARIGGDEFAALACVASREDAMALAERLRIVAEEPVAIELNGITIRLSVGACVGVAIGPVDARTGEALLHAADLALYAAKGAGRGRALAFEPAMAEAAENRRRLEEDLGHALERDQIELHYQVQHCVRSNRVIGYEALMRWRHPERGLIPPDDFIPLAEETGLIVPLGRWALKRAARDFAGRPDGSRVAVNVSPVQFGSGDLATDVARALATSGLEPSRLEVEITEQVLIDDSEATLGTLRAVRALGVGLSLDDFGSGYSSLGYLTRYPFTKIKIDRMFIAAMAADERARALVRSILALAASLGLRVTAEGVETQGQLLSLAADGCDEAQGYLLGRPAPLAELDATPFGCAAA